MIEAAVAMPAPDQPFQGEGGPERSLATFVLLAYNQEKYVREAVEGAFAQTYSPLEIILSDDCSPDGTFAIMQEMAAAYRGPHHVRAAQTRHNLGLIQHLLLRGREAQGDIVVVAAGDDISKPNRVAVLAEAFTPEVGAVYSLNDLIDQHGGLIREGIEGGGRPKSFNDQIVKAMCLSGDNRHVKVTQGSTAAYRSQLFQVPIDGNRKPYSEEMILCYYCYILGLRVEFTAESLIYYREHLGALSNLPDSQRLALARRPEAVARFARRTNMDMYLDFHKIACQLDCKGYVDRSAILRNYRDEEIRFFWIDMSLQQKISSAVSLLIEGNLRSAGWCLTRLLGIFNLVRAKPRFRS